MSYNKREKFLFMAGICLFMFCTLVSMHYTRYMKVHLSAVSVRYEKAVITPEEIQKAMENHQDTSTIHCPEITLWNRLEKQSVKNSITDLSADTNVIETYGDMSEIIPMNFINGNFTYTRDEKGCVLDSKTAYHLFGTVNAVNNTVLWQGKEYVVRGVVKAKDKVMLLQVSDKEHLYSNMEAEYQTKKQAFTIDGQGQRTKDFLLQNGMPEPDAVIDGSFASWLISFTYRLPLWLIVCGILYLMIKNIYRARKSVILIIGNGILTVIVAVVLIKITDFHVHVPSQLIPSKWSDFDFYIIKYKAFSEDMVKNLNYKRMPKDVLHSVIRRRCNFCMVINLFLIFVLNAHHTVKEL